MRSVWAMQPYRMVLNLALHFLFQATFASGNDATGAGTEQPFRTRRPPFQLLVPSCDIKLDPTLGAGYVATGSLRAGAKLATLPFDNCLTEKNAAEAITFWAANSTNEAHELIRALEKRLAYEGPRPPGPSELLTIFLIVCRENRGACDAGRQNSCFGDYVSLLSPTPARNALAFTEQDSRMLAGSQASSHLKTMQEVTEAAYLRLKLEAPLFFKHISSDQWITAASHVLMRQLTVDKAPALIPFLDDIQHPTLPATPEHACHVERHLDSVYLGTRQSYTAGDKIFLDRGVNSTKDLVLKFGIDPQGPLSEDQLQFPVESVGLLASGRDAVVIKRVLNHILKTPSGRPRNLLLSQEGFDEASITAVRIAMLDRPSSLLIKQALEGGLNGGLGLHNEASTIRALYRLCKRANILSDGPGCAASSIRTPQDTLVHALKRAEMDLAQQCIEALRPSILWLERNNI